MLVVLPGTLLPLLPPAGPSECLSVPAYYCAPKKVLQALGEMFKIPLALVLYHRMIKIVLLRSLPKNDTIF